MAKLTYTAITSLDGYIEDEGGSFDWAVPDAEVHELVNDLERPIGTHLFAGAAGGRAGRPGAARRAAVRQRSRPPRLREAVRLAVRRSRAGPVGTGRLGYGPWRRADAREAPLASAVSRIIMQGNGQVSISSGWRSHASQVEL
jgi:hypothetical protein